MITTHQYIDKYPINKKSEKLIVGTIHPHNYENFKIPFFYGNVTSLWTILSHAFPKELKEPLTLNGILSFLDYRKISVSDTIRKCKRVNPTALDRDLVPIELNTQIIEDIRNSNIREVFFTSGFGKNNAFRLFYTYLLGNHIDEKIKLQREVILDKKVFGRPIKLIVLYSPSGTSNVGLSKSKIYLTNIEKYRYSTRPVYDFKVDYYREKFA
jgi:G:T/U-mismatch repair DNA glycosylase